MSLHAQSSPEALHRLHRQQRNSTISSVTIATLTVFLAALLLGWFLLPAPLEESTPVAILVHPAPEPTYTLTCPTPTLIQRRPTSSSAAMPRVLVSYSISNISIPTPDVEITEPSVDFGNGDGFNDAWPVTGDSESFTPIPSGIQKRCSKADRLARLAETGGNPECEDAVVRTLDWLKHHQNSDGSWTSSNQAAMTGFALLAYLGHCETPLSEDYGDTVFRAITYLVDLAMKNGGKLTTSPAEKHWPYEHAIATYALAEATTFCQQAGIKIPQLRESTRMAGQWIIDHQHPKSGGWDYAYNTHGKRGGDLSITAWHLQALKACTYTHLEFHGLERSASKALGYIRSLQCSDGGFAYVKANETPHAGDYRTLTGAAVLCLQMWDKGSTSAARRGTEYIAEHTRFDYQSEFSDLYGHYYEAQAMLNRGGADWRKYNNLLRDSLLTTQNADGSWPPPGNGKRIRAAGSQYTSNIHYRNCLNALMLEVYYRFLPSTSLP